MAKTKEGEAALLQKPHFSRVRLIGDGDTEVGVLLMSVRALEGELLSVQEHALACNAQGADADRGIQAVDRLPARIDLGAQGIEIGILRRPEVRRPEGVLKADGQVLPCVEGDFLFLRQNAHARRVENREAHGGALFFLIFVIEVDRGQKVGVGLRDVLVPHEHAAVGAQVLIDGVGDMQAVGDV